MRRTERQHDLVWGAMGLGMGLLAGFVLAEVVGGRSALGRRMPDDRVPGEQEGAAPVEDDRGYIENDRGSIEGAQGYAELTLADQSA